MVQIRQLDGGYTTENTHCAGNDAQVLQDMACVVPISVLISAPYNLPYGSEIWAKVSAQNIFGSSEAGEGNGAIILTTPTAPEAYNYVPGTTNTQVTIAWPTPYENGGSPIIDYTISYAKVGEDFQQLADSITANQYTATGLEKSQHYKFIVKARNAEGFGPYSEEVIVVVSMVPDAPNMPVTSFAKDPDRVIITWEEPFDRGAQITGYKILIAQSDGVYAEELTYCDGSQAGIISQLSCSIPSAQLMASPHSLTLGSIVHVKVIAINFHGDSDESAVSSETFIRTKPDAPVLVLRERFAYELALEWTPPYDGGTAIIDYRISYDQASDTWVYLEEYFIDTDILAEGLTNQATYKFRIEARNAYGFSDLSDVLEVICASVPDKTAEPTTAVVASNVEISWTAPFNGGSEITAYTIEIMQSDGVYSQEMTHCDGTNLAVIAN